MELIKENYIETEIGKLPKDWKITEISKIATINGRVGWKGYTKKDLVNDGPFAIGAKHINKNNKLDLSDPTCLSIEKYLESPEIMVYKDDVLIVQRGTIGKIVLIENEIGEATINPSMLILRSKNVSSKFIYYYFVSEKGQNQIILDTSSTGVPMITQKQVLNFKIPIPTITEQTAIATALSDSDGLITGLEKLIAKKRNIKQGAMQQLLQPKEGWEVKKLGEVCDVIGGGTPSTFVSEYWNGTINWFTPTEIGKHKYTFESVRKITKEGFINSSGKMLPIGTILLTTRAGIGDVSILMKEGCTNQGFQSLVAKKGYNNEYLYYLITTLKSVLIQNASGSTFLEISPNKIKQIEISISDYNEQNRIATILSDMDAELSVLEQKLEKYKKVKLGMMQELLTGKTRLV